MTDRPRPNRTLRDALADPRIDDEYLRAFDGPENPVLVVGCVHDHPASRYRVETLVRATLPEAVGVELPALAVPLFERAGRDPDVAAGGEMGAALAAARAVGARRNGIDTLDVRLAGSLVSELRRRSASPATLRRVLGAVAGVGRNALSCRFAAALGRYDGSSVLSDRAYDYEVDRSAMPESQAADERRQLARSRSVLRALQRPVADEIVDAARERTMVANLASLGESGSVVAAVGFDHLAGITDGLAARPGWSRQADVDSMCRLWG